jgi:hypothetical protein
MSYDGETEPDIVAMIAASAALTISGVPFMGPIGARASASRTANTSSTRRWPKPPRAASTSSWPRPTTP